MNIKIIGGIMTLVAALLAFAIGTPRLSAGQALLVPSPDRLRYQLIGDEPIAGPDGQSVVNGWSVLVFKDRTESRCYVAFKQGPAITAMESATCPH
jgi:hypothetical protein